MEKEVNKASLSYTVLNDDNIIGQAGTKPIVIIQNNIGSEQGYKIVVTPITSKETSEVKSKIYDFIKVYTKKIVKKFITFLKSLQRSEEKTIDNDIINALGLNSGKVSQNTSCFVETALAKEEKTEFITRRQIASYGVIAREKLKHCNDREVTDEAYIKYIIILMDLYTPEEIEKRANEIQNN